MSTEVLSGSEKAAVLGSARSHVATEVMRHLAEDEVRKVVQVVSRAQRRR